MNGTVLKKFNTGGDKPQGGKTLDKATVTVPTTRVHELMGELYKCVAEYDIVAPSDASSKRNQVISENISDTVGTDAESGVDE